MSVAPDVFDTDTDGARVYAKYLNKSLKSYKPPSLVIAYFLKPSLDNTTSVTHFLAPAPPANVRTVGELAVTSYKLIVIDYGLLIVRNCFMCASANPFSDISAHSAYIHPPIAVMLHAMSEYNTFISMNDEDLYASLNCCLVGSQDSGCDSTGLTNSAIYGWGDTNDLKLDQYTVLHICSAGPNELSIILF